MGSRLEQLKHLKVKMHDWAIKNISLSLIKEVNETGQESWKCRVNSGDDFLLDNEDIVYLLIDFTHKFGDIMDREQKNSELEFHKYDDYDDSTITKE